jgi:hypothetical protein
MYSRAVPNSTTTRASSSRWLTLALTKGVLHGLVSMKSAWLDAAGFSPSLSCKDSILGFQERVGISNARGDRLIESTSGRWPGVDERQLDR